MDGGWHLAPTQRAAALWLRDAGQPLQPSALCFAFIPDGLCVGSRSQWRLHKTWEMKIWLENARPTLIDCASDGIPAVHLAQR